MSVFQRDEMRKLWDAAKEGRLEDVLHQLDVHDVDINWRHRGYGMTTSLHIAVINGHAAIVNLLVENGADTNVCDSFEGDQPLHYACAKNNANVFIFC